MKPTARLLPALAGVLVVVTAQLLGAFELPDRRARDRLLGWSRLPPVTEPIVIVGIDEATLDRYPKPLLLWTPEHAAVLDAAREAGARAVGLDLHLAVRLADFVPGLADPLLGSLAQARAAGLPVVLQAIQTADEGDRQGQLEPPHRLYQLGASATALANLTLDPDGVVRRQELGCEGPQTFAVALATAIGQERERCRTVPIRWRATGGAWPSVPFHEVVERAGDAAWLKENLEGRVVLVGSIAPSLLDHQRTPLQPIERRLTPGVEIHAHALHTLLSDDAPRSPGRGLTAALLIVLGLGSGWLGGTRRPRTAALGCGALVLGWTGALGLAGDGVLLPVSAPLLAATAPGLLAALRRWSDERRTRRQLTRTLGSYVNEHVLAELLEHPASGGISGAKRTVTVLMADIVGYSTFSENRDPAEIVAVLNEYFGAMTEAVQDCGGTVDKFIGDGFMAIFGAPLPLPDDGAPQAVDAALEMERRLEQLQIGWAARGLPELDIGVGIHTGEAVAGNMGSARKMEYTVIGDAVNVAARIESTTRRFDTRVLVSGAVVERLHDPPGLTDLGEVSVKGRAEPVRLYAVHRA